MTCLTVLLSCLLLMTSAWGEECGDHVMEMKQQMKEMSLKLEKMHERGNEVIEMRREISKERREEVMVMRKEITEERREEVMVIKNEMIVIKQEKLELEEKVMELTKKLEIHEKKVTEFKSTRDLPYVMICGYRNYWTAFSSTITYDRLSADYTNTDRPGGGDGNMDITTGMFNALTPGHYTVTYSGHATLNPGEEVRFFLFHNGQYMGEEGMWISSSDSNDAGPTRDQGGKSLVSVYQKCRFMFKCSDHVSLQIIYLGLGDTLYLHTDNSTYFTGVLYHLTFCVTLTAFEY